MNNTDTSAEVTDKSQLTDWFRLGIKPKAEWGIGTEHEQFLYNRKDFSRLAYMGQPGIQNVLSQMQRDGWASMTEEGHLIALAKDGATITLEPGGQFELSGANHRTVHQTYDETRQHFEVLERLGQELGFYNLPMGFDPFWSREKMPWMPKERYRFMKSWMPGKGDLGLDMMSRTASIQVNVDYSSEADMVQKMQVAQAFQPVVMALFANSPFSEGQANGYLTYRSHVWDHTDNDRCGFLPFVFDKSFGFERWTEFLLDVPMYFIHRQGQYHSADGMTFREFMKGQHRFKPTMGDWEVHVSTVFPDIRLKKFIELRGADAGSAHMIAALAAFWTGLLYHADSLAAAHSLGMELGMETLCGLRAEVPKMGLKACYKSSNLLDVARELLQLSDQGLAHRAREMGMDSEQKYLQPLEEILSSGQTRADRLLELYHGRWGGRVDGKGLIG
ncbi:glutamate--cysteine ligase [Geofilum rubicundum]|uniref:Glutamate--cysteine ligase n=1 Tax=Geofilum rubicundum JCM 15548 TaxID=1236989 RepID=A0A0E9LYV5_9BACT|nr:glutamate--cysteine ligase [Geofilum rubicundum]GAO30772.1 glutamate-cysteine ligase [Geofilum rubicundum JCM 15548]